MILWFYEQIRFFIHATMGNSNANAQLIRVRMSLNMQKNRLRREDAKEEENGAEAQETWNSTLSEFRKSPSSLTEEKMRISLTPLAKTISRSDEARKRIAIKIDNIENLIAKIEKAKTATDMAKLAKQTEKVACRHCPCLIYIFVFGFFTGTQGLKQGHGY